MKKLIVILLLMATLLSAFSLPAFADDNAQSGEGTTHAAADGFGWYNSYQYMWKVTVYVGKTDDVTKQSNLLTDFYKIGTVIMKKTGWTLSSGAIFGDKTKADYYSGESMTLVTNNYIVIQDESCPKIPIASGGDIGTVKEYFGSTGTMNTILTALANKAGGTPYSLLSSKFFKIGGQKKDGWNAEYLLPNGTQNRVPWVIVYEPVILMHLKDKVTLCAFTATEFALAQQYKWYDWNYNRGTGQAVGRLTFKHLPTSVQLEESWFGYPVYNVTDDTKTWAIDDIIQGGGWGMRWLDIAVKEGTTQIDYGCYFTTVDTPKPNGYANVTVVWKNYKNVTGTVLCELYRDSTLLWSGNKTFASGQAISQTFNVYYPGTSSATITAKINYTNRGKETDPNDNKRSRTVTPVGEGNIDFGAYIMNYDETPDANSYGSVIVNWWNFEEDAGTVLCELYRDNSLIWSDYKEIESLSYIEQTFSVYYSGTNQRTLTAKINYEYKDEEVDPNDNIDSVTVSPIQTADTTYDFSVSNLSVTPNTIQQGNYATIAFISDNWNKDVAYNDILVEVLVGTTVVKSEKVSFTAYGRNNHSYSIQFDTKGSQTVTARINWENKNKESRVANNSATATATVTPYYEFSVSSVSISKTEAEIGENITVSFVTDSWDKYNSYSNIPVEVLYNGNVVYSANFTYAAYARKNHTVTINVGNTPGTYSIVARVNWADHDSEAKTNNNASSNYYVVVKDSVDLSIQYVTPNSSYREGTDVITSFWIYNKNGSSDIIPSDDVTASFDVYYYQNGVQQIIHSDTISNVVIPNNDKNLIWFKWHVPDGYAGKTIFCEGRINTTGVIDELITTNNTSFFTTNIAEYLICSTPDTQYERAKPSYFTVPSNQEANTQYGSWWQYVYENESFVKKEYKVYYRITSSLLQPATGNSHTKVSGIWNMKSGYGLNISLSGNVTNCSGYTAYSSSMTTSAQYVLATFPEFDYKPTDGNSRTLEKNGSYWVFRLNASYGRVHFTPLWYPNGLYQVYVECSDIWTPGGMLMTSQNIGPVKIIGSAYDDWYVGR